MSCRCPCLFRGLDSDLPQAALDRHLAKFAGVEAEEHGMSLSFLQRRFGTCMARGQVFSVPGLPARGIQSVMASDGARGNMSAPFRAQAPLLGEFEDELDTGFCLMCMPCVVETPSCWLIYALQTVCLKRGVAQEEQTKRTVGSY